MRLRILACMGVCLAIGCGSGTQGGNGGTTGAGGSGGAGGSSGTGGANGSGGSAGAGGGGGSHHDGGTTKDAATDVSGDRVAADVVDRDSPADVVTGPACGTRYDGGEAFGPCPGTETCCPGNTPTSYYCKQLHGGMCPLLP